MAKSLSTNQWIGIILVVLALLLLLPVSFAGKTNLVIIVLIILGVYHFFK